jgi:hypothetical protein
MIQQTQTTSFKAQLYEGVHNLLTDTIKIALYTANADLDETTTVYTSTGEITGTGYTSGGNTLTGANISSSGYTAYVSFNSTQWTGASFTCRGALIYNSSKGNKSIAVLDFGNDKIVSNQTFTITFPADTADSAIIRSSN